MQQVTNIKELETAVNQNGEMVVSKNGRNNIEILSINKSRGKEERI